MRRRPILLAAAALGISCVAAIQPAQAKPTAVQLDMYTVRAPAAEVGAAERAGDRREPGRVRGGTRHLLWLHGYGQWRPVRLLHRHV